MFSHYFILTLFAAAGLTSLLAALCNWDWFFTAQNTRFVVQQVGRSRARLIYGLLGLLLLATAATLMLTGINDGDKGR